MDLIIIFPLCLIILFLLFNGIRFILLHHCHTCISRRARIDDHPKGPKHEEDADDHYSEAGVEGADGARSLPPDNGAYLEPNQIVKRDTTYANINPHIESLQVEGILNRLINSVAAQTLHWSVPVQTEDHDCNQSPENLLKNWSQRILPYESTRVVLTPIFGIESTNYINANYIEGFGGSLKYIASQGPLDATVGDFWRMVWDQRVSAIIMAANFNETSEMYPGCRLTEYMRVGPPLQGNGFTVTILKSRLERGFSASTVQIEHNGATHTLEHYHHPKWEDDTPKYVTRTLAAMLRYFLGVHQEGKVVVHCTDGLARTGTVLMILLMTEMIKHEKRLDIKEVLASLRRCRHGVLVRLEDFDLALETLDELLHGVATALDAQSFKRNFNEAFKRSKALFKKVRELESVPIPEEVQQTPRDSVDRQRVMLNEDDMSADENIYEDEEEDEKEVLDTINQAQDEDDPQHPSRRFVNEVWIDGCDRRRDIIVMKHPSAVTRPRFWRLVVQSRCQNLVLANDYSQHDKGQDFLPLIPGEGGELTFGEYSVQVLAAQAPAQSIIKYEVKVTLNKEALMVAVYKITDWPNIRELPQSPGVVNALVELLCDAPSTPDPSPKLFCCGDGVTASGLLAGAVSVLQRLKAHQEVDIYRTVVALRRCRREFITSQNQFDHLYFVAARYIEATMIYEELD